MTKLPSEIRKAIIRSLADIWGSATWDHTTNKWRIGKSSLTRDEMKELYPFLLSNRPEQYSEDEFQVMLDEVQSLLAHFQLPLPPTWDLPEQKEFTPKQARIVRRYQQRSYHMRYSARVTKKLAKKFHAMVVNQEYRMAQETLIVDQKRARLSSSQTHRNYYMPQYAPTNLFYPNENGEWRQPDGTWKRRTADDLQTPT